MAAAAVGVARTVAAFHLDRLAQEGLLEVTTRRTTGRSGPGAGRPARLYRRAEREVAVSLPPRDYELAATLLAGAVEEAGVEETVEAQARALGEQLGAAAPGRRPPRPRRRSSGARGARLRALPRRGGEVRLRNCAFHALAGDFPVLVCGMNRAFCEGVARGAGLRGVRRASTRASATAASSSLSTTTLDIEAPGVLGCMS